MKNNVKMRECANVRMCGRKKKKNNLHILVFAHLLILFFSSCSNDTEKPTETKKQPDIIKTIPAPEFNADSAYSFVKKQVDFGPRIPGTSPHAKCADYLSQKLKTFGMTVIVQKGVVTTFDNKQFTLKNIIT